MMVTGDHVRLTLTRAHVRILLSLLTNDNSASDEKTQAQKTALFAHLVKAERAMQAAAAGTT